MRRDLTTCALAVVVLTLVLGLAYPLAMTGVAQIAFPGRADGSQIRGAEGRVAGSRLLGQDFAGQPEYFQARPSATGYDPSATFFSNRGPNSAAARVFYRDALAAYLKRERPYVLGLDRAAVPVDAVTTSGSGVDPHISPANACIQAHRIAAVRRLPLDRVRDLVAEHTDGRFLGLVGEPGVNVLELNLVLDREARTR